MLATGCNLRISKVSVLCERLICLCYDHHFFFVSCQIVDFVCNLVRNFVYYSIWSFDKAVLVDYTISSERADKSDVRTFWRLDWAHSAVVRVVYVSNFESGSFSGKTARSECRKSSLVSQLSKRVVLVHELRQLGASEELLDCCRYRPNIHQSLRSRNVDVLSGHSFLYDSLHSRKTDSELVLEKLSNSSQTTVAEMVYIVSCSDAIVEVEDIADRCDDILYYNVLRRQVVLPIDKHFLQFFLGGSCCKYLFENRIKYLVSHLELFDIKINVALKVYKVISYYLGDFVWLFLVERICVNVLYACILDFES